MATIDYNSGNGPVTFFSSNVSFPVRFCDNNASGIQIGTKGSTPKNNTVQIGHETSRLEINSSILDVGCITTFRSTVQWGSMSGVNTVITPETITLSDGSENTRITVSEIRTSMTTNSGDLRESWMTPTELNISSNQKKLTLNEKGLSSSNLELDVMNGELKLRGNQLLSESAQGLTNKFLTVNLNGTRYKIALHDI